MSMTRTTIDKLNETQKGFLRRLASDIGKAKQDKRIDPLALRDFTKERKDMGRGYIRGIVDSDGKFSQNDFKVLWAWFTTICDVF